MDLLKLSRFFLGILLRVLGRTGTVVLGLVVLGLVVLGFVTSNVVEGELQSVE